MDDIEEALKDTKPNKISEGELERSAVIVPIYEDDGGEGILFTRRSDDLPRHAGQVSFPGGRSEKGDDSLLDTALRELYEEVGVPRDEVTVIGRLDDIPTTTGYSIRPFVGRIPYPYDFKIQEEEVDTLIFAPVSELTHPSIYESRVIEDRDLKIHYFHYSDYTIWGATAQILVQLLRIAYGWSPP